MEDNPKISYLKKCLSRNRCCWHSTQLTTCLVSETIMGNISYKVLQRYAIA